MTIQIDSREKARAIGKILNTFDEEGVVYVISKMYVADYMNYDNPKIILDRKQNLGELANNMCSTQKKKDGTKYNRFREELKEVKRLGQTIIILIEDDSINDFEDVKFWSSKHTKVKGETLYKAMKTMESETDKYDVKFMFCKKEETGKKILELLGGYSNEDDGN